MVRCMGRCIRDFELSNLRLGLIEFGFQFRVALDCPSRHAFPIAHVSPQIADYLLQRLDESRQRLELFVN